MTRGVEMMERQDYRDSSSGDEESLLSGSEAPKGSGYRAAVAAVGLFCLAAACFAAVATATLSPPAKLQSAAAPHRTEPLTVRSLLEGPELANLATDNIMSVGHEMLGETQREHVHAAVTRKLQNISDELQLHDPAAHAKLATISLSEAQKESIFKQLRHFGDKRMAGIANDMADAVHETRMEGGDKEALKRRLSEKLAPRLGEMQQLAEELHPGQGHMFSLQFSDDAPIVAQYDRASKWHMKVELSQPEVQGARRLMEGDLARSVVPQAQSMFEKLQEMKPNEMPEAPARMLSMFSTTPSSQSSHGSDSDASFMSCMMEKMGNMDPMGCIGCIMSNMKAVMSMVSSMLMGGR